MRADDEERRATRLVTERAAIRGIETDGVLDPIEGLRAEPCVTRVDGEAAHPAGVDGRSPARSPDQQDARAAPRFEGPEVAPTPAGRRASRSPSRPHGPGCSISSQCRIVEAVPASDSAAARLRSEHRSSSAGTRRLSVRRGSSADPRGPSRRTRTARAPGSGTCSARSPNRELVVLVEARDLTHPRLQPCRHLEAPIPEEDHETIRPHRSSHTEPGRRATTESSSTTTGPARSAIVPRASCARVERNRSRRSRGLRPHVDVAERGRERREPLLELTGESVRVARPPGGDGIVHPAVIRPTTPASTSRHGVTWIPTVR